MSVHEGWWDNTDDLGSTDTGTLSEDDILRLTSLSVTGAPSLVCSGSKAGTAALYCALATCSYCCDASSRMSSSESVPGSVLSRLSAFSHHPLGLNKSMRLRDSHQNAPQPVDKRSQRRAG